MDKYFCAFSQQSGMQRCFFLLFSLALVCKAGAQGADVRHTELSFYATDTFPNQIRARAVLEMKLASVAQEVRFDFQPALLHSVRVKQGRLKDFIPYRNEGDEVVLDLTGWPNRPHHITVAFEYTINLKNPDTQAYIRNEVGVLSFNAFNAYQRKGLAKSGAFFPSLAEDASTYHVNISVPAGYEVFTIGEAGFKVSDPERGITHHFWNCTQALPASSFYLIAGTLKEDELDDLDEIYHFSDTDLSEIRAENLRNANQNLLGVLQELTGFTASDSLLLTLDSVQTLHKLNLQVFPPRSAAPLNQMESEILLYAAGGDSLKAAYLAYVFKLPQESPSYTWLSVREYAEQHARDTLTLPQAVYIQTAEWLRNFYPDYQQKLLNDETYPDSSAYLNFADSVRANPVLPRINIKYRYREGTQNIILTQDTAFRKALAIPVDITVYLRDTTIRVKRVSDAQAVSMLKIEASASPQSVQVNPGRYFPAYVEDQRPDVYNLYQLSNAKSETERIDALTRLFQTSNSNLFSTALGIAMDDPNAEIRSMALQQADDLNAAAQYKLKDTLLKMAGSDPDPRLRKTAERLVLKYYPQK